MSRFRQFAVEPLNGTDPRSGARFPYERREFTFERDGQMWGLRIFTVIRRMVAFKVVDDASYYDSHWWTDNLADQAKFTEFFGLEFTREALALMTWCNSY